MNPSPHPLPSPSASPPSFASLSAWLLLLTGILTTAATNLAAQENAAPPHPGQDPASPLMLAGDWVPSDPARIDFTALPRVPSNRVVVNDARKGGGVNQHPYLTRYVNQYWLMWSDGPGIEDRVGQRVSVAVSDDGLTWSTPAYLTPEPPISGPSSPHFNTHSRLGFRWIARGFWPRRGELLALASLDEAMDVLGPSLQLRAFRLDPKTDEWHDAGILCENAINNFPPLQLPANGPWMMSRRTHDYRATGLQFLIGGEDSIDRWDSFPLPGTGKELAPEEPFWWALPDGRLAAFFQDPAKGRLHRSLSADAGRTWTLPVCTNFPTADSRFHGTRLTDGRYVLVSSPHPAQRDPLVLSISPDGLVFHEMLWLTGGRPVESPFILEDQGQLLVAFSGGKQTVEVLRVKLADLDPQPAHRAKDP